MLSYNVLQITTSFLLHYVLPDVLPVSTRCTLNVYVLHTNGMIDIILCHYSIVTNQTKPQ